MVRVILPPRTITVAVRSVDDGLAVTVTVTVPSFDPEEGVTVSQEVALLLPLVVQSMLEATVNVSLPAAGEKFKEAVDAVKKGAAPACVTLMVRVMPLPLMVIVAVRPEVDVWPAAVTLTVPSFVPDDRETVSHVSEPLLTVQIVLDSIVNVCCSPAAGKLNEAGVTVKMASAPSCDTLMVCFKSSPVIVIVAVRADADGLAMAFTVTVLSFEPDSGETVSQEVALLLTVQLVLVSIVSDFSSADDEKLMAVSETDNEATNPPCFTLTERTMSPPLTVRVAVRCDLSLFSKAVTLTVPLFEPDNGETLSQEGSLFVTFHFTFDSTVNEF